MHSYVQHDIVITGLDYDGPIGAFFESSNATTPPIPFSHNDAQSPKLFRVS